MNKAAIKAVVDEQAKDDGLWFIAQTAPEAYLQQELRRLHAVIEGRTPEQCARALLDKAVMGFANTMGPAGSESNPIKVDSEYPFPAGGFDLPYGDRPYLWAITPKGKMVKCYRSYSDYCDD